MKSPCLLDRVNNNISGSILQYFSCSLYHHPALGQNPAFTHLRSSSETQRKKQIWINFCNTAILSEQRGDVSFSISKFPGCSAFSVAATCQLRVGRIDSCQFGQAWHFVARRPRSEIWTSRTKKTPKIDSSLSPPECNPPTEISHRRTASLWHKTEPFPPLILWHLLTVLLFTDKSRQKTVIWLLWQLSVQSQKISLFAARVFLSISV